MGYSRIVMAVCIGILVLLAATIPGVTRYVLGAVLALVAADAALRMLSNGDVRILAFLPL